MCNSKNAQVVVPKYSADSIIISKGLLDKEGFYLLTKPFTRLTLSTDRPFIYDTLGNTAFCIASFISALREYANTLSIEDLKILRNAYLQQKRDCQHGYIDCVSDLICDALSQSWLIVQEVLVNKIRDSFNVNSIPELKIRARVQRDLANPEFVGYSTFVEYDKFGDGSRKLANLCRYKSQDKQHKLDLGSIFDQDAVAKSVYVLKEAGLLI